MSIGKANGDERAALSGRVMERADDSAGVTGTEAQPTVTVTMRLAEAEWHVVRQEVLPRFEAACNCRVRAIDVPPETLVQRLRAMHQAGRIEIDLFAQDNMRLQELINTALASPFTPEESQVEEAIYP